MLTLYSRMNVQTSGCTSNVNICNYVYVLTILYDRYVLSTSVADQFATAAADPGFSEGGSKYRGGL